MFKRLIVLSALAFSSLAVAHADPITGTLNFTGFDATYNDPSTPGEVTFGSTGLYQVTGSTSTLALLGMTGPATFTNFNFLTGPTPGEVLFNIAGNGLNASLTIDGFDPTSGITSADFLNVTGTGVLHETGFDDTIGTFFVTAHPNNGSVDVSFAAGTNIPSAVPEPASLALFGTGLLGVVGIARRKFNV